MSGRDEAILGGLAGAFIRMGANDGAARTMASQLLKRARQLAAERNVDESVTMAELLEKVAAGRRGDYRADVGDSPRTGKSD